MQVNLSANMPNPPCESCSKSAENPDGADSGSFYAQMGQILSQDVSTEGITQGAASIAPQSAPPDSAQGTVSDAVPQDAAGNTGPVFRPAGKPGAQDPLPWVETIPVQIRDEEIDNIAGVVPIAAAPAAGVNIEAVVVLDLTAHVEDLLRSQNGAGTDYFLTNENSPAAASDTCYPAGEFAVANAADLFSQTHTPAFEEPMSGSSPDAAGPQTTGAGLPERNASPNESVLIMSAISPVISSRQSRHSQGTPPEAMEESPLILYAPKGSGDGIGAAAERQAAQLNFDFPSEANSQTAKGIPVRSPGDEGTRKADPANDFVQLGNPEGKHSFFADAAAKNFPIRQVKTTEKNADTNGASGGQKQEDPKAASLAVMQNKVESETFGSGRPLHFAVERQSSSRPVFASNPVPGGEAAATTNSPPAQVSTSRAPDIVFQLADQISIQVRDGKGEIRIQLKPESLGRMEIKVEATAQGVSARISTESGAVKSYLESNLQMLLQTLQDQGLKIDRIQVTVQDAFDSQSSSGFSAQFGHAGSGQNGREAHLPSGKSESFSGNSVDEAVPDAESWLALNPNKRFYTIA